MVKIVPNNFVAKQFLLFFVKMKFWKVISMSFFISLLRSSGDNHHIDKYTVSR